MDSIDKEIINLKASLITKIIKMSAAWSIWLGILCRRYDFMSIEQTAKLEKIFRLLYQLGMIHLWKMKGQDRAHWVNNCCPSLWHAV